MLNPQRVITPLKRATMRSLLTLAALIAASTPTVAAPAAPGDAPAQATATYTFAPDATIQAALSELAAAPDAPARASALATLTPLDTADRPDFIRNLVAFTRDARTTSTGMLAGSIIRELAIPPRDVVSAVAPLLDTADEGLRAQAANILGEYEDRSAVRPPDFSLHRELIESADRAGEELPRGLIAHMFATDPGTALLTIARATRLGERDHAQLKRLVWSEHVVADATWRQDNGFLDKAQSDPAALTELTARAAADAWWQRLYVAEILRQRPALSTPALRTRLLADSDAQVRSLAAQPSAEPGAAR